MLSLLRRSPCSFKASRVSPNETHGDLRCLGYHRRSPLKRLVAFSNMPPKRLSRCSWSAFSFSSPVCNRVVAATFLVAPLACQLCIEQYQREQAKTDRRSVYDPDCSLCRRLVEQSLHKYVRLTRHLCLRFRIRQKTTQLIAQLLSLLPPAGAFDSVNATSVLRMILSISGFQRLS